MHCIYHRSSHATTKKLTAPRSRRMHCHAQNRHTHPHPHLELPWQACNAQARGSSQKPVQRPLANSAVCCGCCLEAEHDCLDAGSHKWFNSTMLNAHPDHHTCRKCMLTLYRAGYKRHTQTPICLESPHALDMLICRKPPERLSVEIISTSAIPAVCGHRQRQRHTQATPTPTPMHTPMLTSTPQVVPGEQYPHEWGQFILDIISDTSARLPAPLFHTAAGAS